MDTYERDFIDDSHLFTPSRHKQQRGRRVEREKRVKSTDRTECSSDSSDEVTVLKTRHTSDRKKKVVVHDSSSDSEGGVPVISGCDTDQSQHMCTSKELLELKKDKTQKYGDEVVSEDSDEEEPNVPMTSLKRRKKTFSLKLDSDESEVEGDSDRKAGGGRGQKRRRLVKRPESDDEIRYCTCTNVHITGY